MGSSSKAGYVTAILRVLILLLGVKIVWFIAEMIWFPAEGVNHADERHAKPLYYKVKLAANKTVAPPVVKKKPVGSIRDITLLGVYSAPDVTVVTVKYKGKTKVLGRGDMINGFTLEDAGSDFATFSKSGKMYRVDLIKPKRKGKGSIESVPAPKADKQPDSGTGEEKGEIIDAGDHKIVERSLFDHYVTHMNDIYKNIGIKEIKTGDKIDGFKITFVKRGSPFAKLGVKRGDIIKSVNGQELTSYNAAFEVYRSMNDVQNITLEIQRGNKKMELEYEIN
jgi:general secretion pathway protein C